MNRQIEFRGKRIEANHQFVNGFYINIQNKEHYILCESKLGLLHEQVIPETVGQYIGLMDSKGIKIFEGDILKVGENLICEIVFIENNNEDYGDEIHSAFHAKVLRHNKTIPLDSYLKNNCKVIGNVFENPELLK